MLIGTPLLPTYAKFASPPGRSYSYFVARVLIVDDEFDIREAVEEVLSEEGHQCLSAGDGAEALACLRDFHPQLVLLDLMMPGMNGWEFRAAQQGDPEFRSIPVVILSALGREGSIDADGFMQKPFDLDDLLATVRRHASTQPYEARAH